MARVGINQGGVIVKDGKVLTDEEGIDCCCEPDTEACCIPAPVSFSLCSVNPTAESFYINGDHSGIFIAGVTFDVEGSLNNDGTYTIVRSELNGPFGGSCPFPYTRLVVVEALASAHLSGTVVIREGCQVLTTAGCAALGGSQPGQATCVPDPCAPQPCDPCVTGCDPALDPSACICPGTLTLSIPGGTVTVDCDIGGIVTLVLPVLALPLVDFGNCVWVIEQQLVGGCISPGTCNNALSNSFQVLAVISLQCPSSYQIDYQVSARRFFEANCEGVPASICFAQWITTIPIPANGCPPIGVFAAPPISSCTPSHEIMVTGNSLQVS